MSEWTKSRLEQMIQDEVEERHSLDYKSAEALGKSQGKKDEITKDVVSFANSAGGTLIYGVSEYQDEARKHLPERLDPIDRRVYSKEWLDQIIQRIQPRIDGLVIHPVTISKEANTVCYVVVVPQSNTAHMAADHRYHKCHNFTTTQMEDYEVRDVMNRQIHPKIEASVYVNRRSGWPEPKGRILVDLRNVGSVRAQDVMIDLEVPFDLGGLVCPEEPVTVAHDEDGDFFRVRLLQGIRRTPLFPGATLRFHHDILLNTRIEHREKRAVKSREYFRLEIFADNMPALRAKLSVSQVVSGWVSVT